MNDERELCRKGDVTIQSWVFPDFVTAESLYNIFVSSTGNCCIMNKAFYLSAKHTEDACGRNIFTVVNGKPYFFCVPIVFVTESCFLMGTI